MKPTPVIFRMIEGECIAYFPTIPGTSARDCLCYQHVGQHGAASLPPMGRRATPNEYANLAVELTDLGYDLAPRRRVSRKDDTLRAAAFATPDTL